MKKQVNSLLLWLCFLHILIVSVLTEPEVQLSTGRVRGQKLESAANRIYYSFRSIPYAAPPIGFLRFKAPQPPRSWNETLEAFDIPPACSQPWRELQFPERYSEDCLYINVFTPYLKPPRGVLMPVMVWIHGGKHFQGSSTSYKYGADFLLTGDVIVVTFNYRLGIFGYLNLKSKSAQGNAAAKDMVAALKWVKKEIVQFGGDPKTVTIFGGSSGGQDVNCLYISPMAKGLFHRAIAHSAGTCEAKYNVNTTKPAFSLAKMLGCPSTDAEAAVACLRGITAEVLAEKQIDVAASGTGEKLPPFSHTVEEDFGEEVFLATPAEELLTSSHSRVPYMLGMNNGEGMMFVDMPEDNPTQFSDFERDFESYLPADILENGSNYTIDRIAKKLKNFYFDDKPISYEAVDNYMQFMMDSKFTYLVAKIAKTLSSHAPVYLYYFTFKGEFETHHENDKLNLSGVNHGEELGYLFFRNAVVPEHNHMSDYPRECATLTRMVLLWTNFAKYGNPTPNKSDVVLNATWLPVKETLTQHLVINDSLCMITQEWLPQRVAIWETVFGWVQYNYEPERQIAIDILLFVFVLALISCLYLLYSSSCRNGYVRFKNSY